jgi:hypothetical protein
VILKHLTISHEIETQCVFAAKNRFEKEKKKNAKVQNKR